MRHWLDTTHDCPQKEAYIESAEQFWGVPLHLYPPLTTGVPILSLAALCPIP